MKKEPVTRSDAFVCNRPEQGAGSVRVSYPARLRRRIIHPLTHIHTRKQCPGHLINDHGNPQFGVTKCIGIVNRTSSANASWVSDPFDHRHTPCYAIQVGSQRQCHRRHTVGRLHSFKVNVLFVGVLPGVSSMSLHTKTPCPPFIASCAAFSSPRLRYSHRYRYHHRSFPRALLLA